MPSTLEAGQAKHRCTRICQTCFPIYISIEVITHNYLWIASIFEGSLSSYSFHARFSVYSETMAKLHRIECFTPKQQGRAVEHQCGACRTTPRLRMPHTFRAASQAPHGFLGRGRTFPFLTGKRVGCVLPRDRRSFSKNAASSKPDIPLRHQRMLTKHRRAVGMAQLSSFSVPCLYELITLYIYIYIAIFCSIYKYLFLWFVLSQIFKPQTSLHYKMKKDLSPMTCHPANLLSL